MIRALILLLLLANPARAIEFFGYAGVMCDVDDPLDASDISDYSAEVAGFTNANQVCLPADPAQWADRISRANAQFRPVLNVEGAFDFSGAGPDGATALAVWALLRAAVADSDVDPARIIFYLVDEPTLRGIPAQTVDRAAAIIRRDFPTAEVLLVEACSLSGPPPIAPHLTLWGVDCYALSGPAAAQIFATYLDLAQARMGPGQRLVLVMDANHTPVHAAAGLDMSDMAGVARAYADMALNRPGVAGMLGYTWVGGLDNPDERGVRDMPQSVIAAHREVGRLLLGLQ